MARHILWPTFDQRVNQGHPLLSGLRISHYICKGCNERRTFGNRKPQAGPRGSGVVRCKIIREPVRVSVSVLTGTIQEKTYQPMTAGALGKTPKTWS